MNIIVYTTEETLNHKKGIVAVGENDGVSVRAPSLIGAMQQYYYWNFPRPPKQLEEGDKIFFACEGMIQGYFIVDEFNPDDEEMVVWDKDSWVELKKKIPTKSFQGFKYANKVEGLDDAD